MLPKFLICDTHETDRVFVLHTQFPKFLAEAFCEFESEEEELKCKAAFPSGSSVEIDGETEVLGVVEWYEEPTGMSVDDVAKLMSAMGDWYYKEIMSYDNDID